MKLVLASGSPRRIEFLKKWGFDFQVKKADFKEKTFKCPEETAIYNAFGKASLVAMRYKNSIVIGADTVVVIDNKIMGKPKDKTDLKVMLSKLSNRTHTVITGLALVRNTEFITNISKTEVTFRKVDNYEIERYINTGEGNDKAGGYAIQGLASDFIIKVDGLLDNVIGMPIATFRKMLKEIER